MNDKTKKPTRKISIRRETVRHLSRKALGEVAGGVTTTGGPTSDLTYHCTPYPGSQARLCY